LICAGNIVAFIASIQSQPLIVHSCIQSNLGSKWDKLLLLEEIFVSAERVQEDVKEEEILMQA
jgi:hypothetical protein